VKLGISLKEKKLILGAREDKVLRRNWEKKGEGNKVHGFHLQ
jgi:hypothetical protein